MFDLLKKEWQPIVVGVLFIVYCVVGFKYLWDMDHKTIRYDCSISEISPDFPLEVRDACRKLRANK